METILFFFVCVFLRIAYFWFVSFLILSQCTHVYNEREIGLSIWFFFAIFNIQIIYSAWEKYQQQNWATVHVSLSKEVFVRSPNVSKGHR